MSRSLSPWIATYLVDVAEQHGADIISIQKHERKKKVQLIEFLTYTEDDVIWAHISDKDFVLPIRFSRDAIRAYNALNSTRLTSYKTAIIFVQKFKPFFARIPTGPNTGMSNDCFLALDCDAFSLVGSFGEPTFGNPKMIKEHPDLLEWSEGLKKDGGAGNCLKNRKKEREELASASIPPDVSSSPKHLQPAVVIPVEQSKDPASSSRDVSRPTNPSRERRWPIAKDMLFAKPPPEIALILSKMKVDGDSNSDLHGSESQQHQTCTGSPPPKSRTTSRERAISLNPPSSPRSATPLSDWLLSEPDPPPPGQPRRHSPPTSPLPPSLTKADDTPLAESLSLPESSGGTVSQVPCSVPSSQLVIAEETILSQRSPSRCGPHHLVRKVPEPLQPIHPTISPAKSVILVPPSDVSASYSLSQQESQSQSLNSSQPVILSQHADLSKSPNKLPAFPPQQSIEASQEVEIDNHHDSLFSESHSQAYDGDQSSNIASSSKSDMIVSSRAPDRHVSDHHKHSSLVSRLENEDIQTVEESQNPASRAEELPISLSKKQVDASLPAVDSPITRNRDNVSVQLGDRPGSDEPRANGASAPEKDAPAIPQTNQVFDDDDVQIHFKLFGSFRPQASSTQQTGKHRGVAPGTQKSPPPEQSSIDRTRHEKVKALGEVQHDPEAWKEPSFMKSLSSKKTGSKSKTAGSNSKARPVNDKEARTSMSTNVSTSLPPSGLSRIQTLQPSRLANYEIPDRVQPGKCDSHANGQQEHVQMGGIVVPLASRGKQKERDEKSGRVNGDGQGSAVIHPNIAVEGAELSKRPLMDGDEDERERKRRKKTDESKSHWKERAGRHERPAEGGGAKAGEKLPKLNGFTADLDRIKLEGGMERRVVTWTRLVEILQLTSEDRRTERR